MNTAAGIAGAAGAMIIAVYLGLRVTLLAGAGLYLLAMVAGRIESKRPAATTSRQPAAVAGR